MYKKGAKVAPSLQNVRRQERKIMTVPETKKFEIEIGGKTVTVETGKYAQSTNGSVTVRCGDTMLFVH